MLENLGTCQECKLLTPVKRKLKCAQRRYEKRAVKYEAKIICRNIRDEYRERVKSEKKTFRKIFVGLMPV